MRRGALVLTALLWAGCATLPVAPVPPDGLILQDIGTLALVVDPSRGAAISHLWARDGSRRSPDMIDNLSPTGRQLQAAWWDGPCRAVSDTDLCAGAPNCLNPTAAGDACGRRSGGTVVEHTADHITVESTPLDFSGTLQRPLTVVTTVTLAGPGLIRLDYRITNVSGRPFGGAAWQTIPVLFSPPEYSVLSGACPDACETVTDDLWRRQSPQEWQGRSTPEGWSMVILAPGLHPWSVGFPGAQSPGAGWMQPLLWLPLAPGQTETVTVWIAVGPTLSIARARLQSIQ